METGGWLAVFEVELVFAGADTWFGVGQRLLAHVVYRVLVVKVVGVLKRTLYRHRRIYRTRTTTLIDLLND